MLIKKFWPDIQVRICALDSDKALLLFKKQYGSCVKLILPFFSLNQSSF